MPISNNATVVPTMNAFIAHWEQVNAVMATPLVVAAPDKTAVTLAIFTDLRNSLEAQLQTVVGFLNDREIARGDIELEKVAMLPRLREFNGLLDGYWGDTAFRNARPYAPSQSDGQEAFLSPMRDMVTLWAKLNAAPAPAGITLPLELADTSVAGDFQNEIDLLQTAYATYAAANQNVVLARARRDEIIALARALIVTYRKVVPSRCIQFPTLVETLPALTPPPGHTPDPVNASAVFEEPDKAKLVYEESTDAKLSHYELRGNPGPEYNDEDAVVIANNLPEDDREFLTGFGLTQPGTSASFKVYVMLTTGNEAGSAAMTVERPG